jgi:hypothetical protein
MIWDEGELPLAFLAEIKRLVPMAETGVDKTVMENQAGRPSRGDWRSRTFHKPLAYRLHFKWRTLSLGTDFTHSQRRYNPQSSAALSKFTAYVGAGR